MRHICLAIILHLSFVYAQQNTAYFVPNVYKMHNPHAFILKDNEEVLEILRMNYGQYEWICYPKNNDKIYARRIKYLYSCGKKNKISFYDAKQDLIVHSDSLTFAVMGEESDEMTKAVEGLYYRKFKFYKKRLHAIFNYRPVLEETKDPRAFFDWSQSPFTGSAFVQGACANPDNLDCLCAALTYNKETPETKANAIASFVVEHFNYKKGDTAQTNIKGLVFGKEKLAICEGYSRVYQDLMERIGCDTKYMSGAVRTDVYDIFYCGHSHAWNQTYIGGKPYSLDITWSENLNSNWYLMHPKDFQISHFDTGRDKENKNWGDSTMTMYEFLHQPLINPIDDGGAFMVKQIDKTLPFQCAIGTFTLNFAKQMTVNSVNRQELSYPFVRFDGEGKLVTTKVIAKSGKIINKIATNKLDITLPERMNNIQINIEGIGTLNYVVFNGSESEFYKYLIDQKNPKSAHSMALAFLACAKLNDPKIFDELKSYINDGVTFKDFMKQAKEQHIDEYKFTAFNACLYTSYTYDANYKLVKKKPQKPQKSEKESFMGYSFEFSQPHKGEVSKIFLSENEDNTYSFAKFNTKSW